MVVTTIPFGAYFYLRSRQAYTKQEMLRLEQEGRDAWIQDGDRQGETAKGDQESLGVKVGSSSGSI